MNTVTSKRNYASNYTVTVLGHTFTLEEGNKSTCKSEPALWTLWNAKDTEVMQCEVKKGIMQNLKLGTSEYISQLADQDFCQYA